MVEETIPNKHTRRPGNSYVFQDGVHHRSHIRNHPEWNRNVTIGVVCSIVFLIALIVIGVFFFNDSAVRKEQETTPSSNAVPLRCIANRTTGHTFLAEDLQISPNYRYYFYASRMSFSKAQQVCGSLPGGGGNLSTIQSEKQEKLFNKRIEDLYNQLFADDDNIFTGFRKQLWTGGYIDLELDGINRMRWIDDTSVSEWHQNFCNPNQASEILQISMSELKEKGAITNTLIYVVKDYRSSKKKGCWQLYSSLIYETEHLEFNFVCQVSTTSLPFRFERKVIGDFRQEANNEVLANEFAIFSGRASYRVAVETCQNFAPGAQMLSPVTLARDTEINKIVERHSFEIFGEDNGDPQRRTLIWSGGYFNVSSEDPTKVHWADDTKTLLDIEELQIRTHIDRNANNASEYENFCGTIEYYNEMIREAKRQESDAAKNTGCIRDRLFLIVKDFREGQTVQGCWHIYDFDYLNQYDYKLYLICQLPDLLRRIDEGYQN